jgi:hypothetical protein
MSTASLPRRPQPRLHLVGGVGPSADLTHPRLEGTFRSPEGRRGTLTGSLRLERLLITPQGTFVSGVVSGHLRDAGGRVLAVASRSVTTAADLVQEGGRTTARVRPFELDLIGIPVHVAAFSVDPTLAVAADAPALAPEDRSR